MCSSVKYFVEEFGKDGVIPRNANKKADVVSMDGGKFQIFPGIGHKKFNDFVFKKISQGQLDISYVTNTPHEANQVLWFDCDKIASSVNVEIVLDVIMDILLKHNLVNNVNVNKAKKQSFILKNKSQNKYHFYVATVYATKKIRTEITTDINKQLKTKKINAELDESAHNIRFEGQYKYVRKSGRGYYDKSSNYEVIYPNNTNLKTFYKHVNVLRYVAKSGYCMFIWVPVNNSNRTSSETAITSTISTSEPNSDSTSQLSAVNVLNLSPTISTTSIPNSQSTNTSLLTTLATSANGSNVGFRDKDFVCDDDDEFHDVDQVLEKDGKLVKSDNQFAVFSNMVGTEKCIEAVKKSIQKEKNDSDNLRNIRRKITIDECLEQFDGDEEAIKSVKKCCYYVCGNYSIIDVEYQKSINAEETTKTRFNCSDAEECPFNNNNRRDGHQIYLEWDHVAETLTKKCEHFQCSKKVVQLDYLVQAPNEIHEEIKEANDNASETSPENNPSNMKNNIFQEITIRYPFILSELKHYKITDIRRYGEKNSIVFVCGNKSEASRTCPFRQGHIHSKSNHYLVYKSKTGNLHLKCHGTGCENKAKLLWSRKDNTALPKANDVDLATLFISLYDDIIYSATDITNKGFYYKGDYYWIFDKDNMFIARRLQTKFADYVDDLFRVAINECQEEKQIELMSKDRWACEQLLKMHYKCKNVIACLKNWLHKPKINWNSNAMRVVFPNGVLNLDTGKFGKSEADEYINDSKMMGCEYKPRNEEFIRKEIHEGLFCKIFPDTKVRTSWLQFISVCFEGRNFKKCAINHGPSGNNGKSKTCELIIYMFGDYAAMGDVKVLLKGKKDRASLANLHQKRFIVYEEPDDTKAMDTCAMKRFIGGVDTLCARLLYSSEDQIDLHNKICINVNCLPGIHNKIFYLRSLHSLIYYYLSGLTADEATLKRLIYYPWIAQFVDNEDKVDHPSYKYLSNPKYSDKRFWAEVAPQLVHYLLDYYKQFKSQGRKLYVPPELEEATRNFVYINDPFMTWFQRHFKLLDIKIDENKKKFVTYVELEELFSEHKDKDRIVTNKYSTIRAFLKKQIQKNSDLSLRWRQKITNWRISAEERHKYKNVVDKSCKCGQYVGAGLQYCERTLSDDVSLWNYEADEDALEINKQKSKRLSKLSRRNSLNHLIHTLESECNNDDNSDDNIDDVDEALMAKLIDLTKKVSNNKKRKRNEQEMRNKKNANKKRKKK